MFVVFSPETLAKYDQFYTAALREYQALPAEYQAGGYVGLVLQP